MTTVLSHYWHVFIKECWKLKVEIHSAAEEVWKYLFLLVITATFPQRVDELSHFWNFWKAIDRYKYGIIGFVFLKYIYLENLYGGLSYIQWWISWREGQISSKRGSPINSHTHNSDSDRKLCRNVTFDKGEIDFIDRRELFIAQVELWGLWSSEKPKDPSNWLI